MDICTPRLRGTCVTLKARYVVLDLGTGDGRLIRLIKVNTPDIEEAVALDVSPTMLKSTRDHFANDSRIKIIEHDLSQPLPDFGYFDAVVSSFAIHHLKHERKRELKKSMTSSIQQEYFVI